MPLILKNTNKNSETEEIFTERSSLEFPVERVYIKEEEAIFPQSLTKVTSGVRKIASSAKTGVPNAFFYFSRSGF